MVANVGPGLTLRLRLLVILAITLLSVTPGWTADKEYSVTGMVLRVDSMTRIFYVSHDRIVGLMDSMTMPFEVRDAKELQSVEPGAIVEFTLVVGDASAYATRIRMQRYESVEQDSSPASRLASLKRVTGAATPPLVVDQQVPDFTLIDQVGARVALSDFAGKVVALNFIYTRCALPQLCPRMSNNFGVLQKRFVRELGRDLVLVTVTFDPERDTAEVLANYASQWKPDPKNWHFLTGSVPDVRRVCAMFGVDFFPEEGLTNHSLHAAVIDRTGKLVGNIEGNQYSPQQLGDLVWATLNR